MALRGFHGAMALEWVDMVASNELAYPAPDIYLTSRKLLLHARIRLPAPPERKHPRHHGASGDRLRGDPSRTGGVALGEPSVHRRDCETRREQCVRSRGSRDEAR